MRDSENHLSHYIVLPSQYFESIETRTPTREFHDVAMACCGDGWNVVVGGYWTRFIPTGYPWLAQGWKIHLSANLQTAPTVLDRVAPLLGRRRVAFKFCSDAFALGICCSKTWHRTASGKFVTIYPRNDAEFGSLLEALHALTHDLTGPYLLTDRPYMKSRVVFYRYGEHSARGGVGADGQMRHHIVTPTGQVLEDVRRPFYVEHAWAPDPFSVPVSRSSTTDAGPVLLNGRYKVGGAKKYSAWGGVYLATDTRTDTTVILREMRGGLVVRNNDSARTSLTAEARILDTLAPTNLTPRVVDLFSVDSHEFLALEYVAGTNLWGHQMNLWFGPAALDNRALWSSLRSMIVRLAHGVDCINAHGVVMRDITKTNILVTPNEEPRFVDFEFAYDVNNGGKPVRGFTPGYASPEQLRGETPTPAEDWYALGSIIVDLLACTATGLHLHRDGVLASLKLTLADAGLPANLVEIVEGLLADNPGERWSPRQAAEAVENLPAPSEARTVLRSGCDPLVGPSVGSDRYAAIIGDVRDTVAGTVRYLTHLADTDAADRLWPGSPETHFTNGVGWDFGATGPAHFLFEAAGSVDPAIVDWIVQRAKPEICPPGLGLGLAGVALFLMSTGRTDIAQSLLDTDRTLTRVLELPGLSTGAAGWGLAQLRLWKMTGDPDALRLAVEVGTHLARTSQSATEGSFWTTNGMVPLGLGFGPSGIALFLTYLAYATGREEFADLALRAIRFDIAHFEYVNGLAMLSRRAGGASNVSRSPHTQQGAIGVGVAALRLHTIARDALLKDVVERCAFTAGVRYTNKLWQHYGLAGYGELLLDAYQALGDERYLMGALHVAEGLMPYRIHTDTGTAFPGAQLLRISCDYAMGGAGIGMFLHRLLAPKTRLRNPLADSVLEGAWLCESLCEST